MNSELKLTTEQTTAVYAEESIAVLAGAGTGKTFLLTHRYMFHLSQGLSPLEVVAVTFTEKAATEIRSRIRKEVEKEVENNQDFSVTTLAEIEASQISTIHALCSAICRTFPSEAGVPADFNLLDELDYTVWFEDHFFEALLRVPEAHFTNLGFSLMRKTLEALHKDPLISERALAVETDVWLAKLEELKTKKQAEFFSTEWQEAVNVLRMYKGADGDNLEEVRQQVLAHIDSELPLSDLVNEIGSLKKQRGKKTSWGEELELVRNSFGYIRDHAKSATGDPLFNWEWSEADDRYCEIIEDVKIAFGIVDSYLQEEKREARALNFSDLERYALNALQHEHVAESFQNRWKAFLIDEFQDTNPIQAKILSVLTKHAVKTIVGDEKQSIYGFRRADVEVFRAEAKAINNSSELSKSFRTNTTLVESLNATFAEVMQEDFQALSADRAAPQEAKLITAYSNDTDATKGIGKATVMRAEARFLCKRIDDFLENNKVWDDDTSEFRAAQLGDIAILSRTWDPLDVYAEALSEVGIAHVHAGGGNLLETREAQDALALLDFLNNPSDDIALMTVLRSPFFAISDKVLMQSAASKEDEQSWWKHLQETSQDSTLGEKLASELVRTVSVLSDLLRQASIESPARLLQLADKATGYSAVIANLAAGARREADWRGFLTFLRSIDKSEGLFYLCRRLKRLAASDARIPRSSLSAVDAVTLMTIHSAKGLEWPIVFLPDLGRMSARNTESVFVDPDYGVGIKMDPAPGIFHLTKEQTKKLEEAELKRLLYVASTRAKDYLLLSSCEGIKNALEVLNSGLENAGVVIETLPFSEELSQPFTPAVTTPEQVDYLNLGKQSFVEDLPVTSLTTYKQCPKRFEYEIIQGHAGKPQTGTGRHGTWIGTLTHAALQYNLDTEEKLRIFEATAPTKVISEALALAKSFWESDVYADFQVEDAVKEKTFTTEIAGVSLNGVIDLQADNFILDYKTDQAMHPEEHVLQVLVYALASGAKEAHIAYLRHDAIHTFSQDELLEKKEQLDSVLQAIKAAEFTATPTASKCSYCPYADICEESVS